MPVAERRQDYEVKDVARELNISLQTAYRMLWRGELPFYRIGSRLRVRAEDVERLRQAQTEPELPPWLADLSPESRAAIAASVAEWPDLTDGQRERLRLLFRPTNGGGA